MMMKYQRQWWCLEERGVCFLGQHKFVFATSLKDNGGQDVVCSVTHVLLHHYCLLSFPGRGETEG